MTKKLAAAVTYNYREVAELRAEPELAVVLLRSAMESLDYPDDRAVDLLALRTAAEAYGGLGAIASDACISRESLYRALSPIGNPTLKPLFGGIEGSGHEAFCRVRATRCSVIMTRPGKARD